MSRRLTGRLVWFFAMTLALALVAGVALQAAGTHVTSSAGPTGYQGIVAADFEVLNNLDPSPVGDDEIVGDFGSAGVWIYKNGSWYQISVDNPEWMFARKHYQFNGRWGNSWWYNLVADFGAKGLWEWHYPGTWTQLTTANAESAVAVDDDFDLTDELQVDFGALGLWHYDWVWTQLTASNPSGCGLRSDVLDPAWAQEGVWDFDAAGLWAVHRVANAFTWQQLSASNPTGDWAAGDFVEDPDGGEELVVAFEGLGTWVYDDGTWTRITTAGGAAMVPARIRRSATSDTYTELVFGDDHANLWCWYGPGSWAPMSYSPMEPGFAAPWNPDAAESTAEWYEQELAVDFGALGLWYYNYSASGTVVSEWKQLTTANPVFMLGADYFATEAQTVLVASFGPGVGLWAYDKNHGGWWCLTTSAPDSSIAW